MKLIVIHEVDYEFNENSVIGVADSVENAEKIIQEYYGDHEVVSKDDIRDSDLEYSKILLVDGLTDKDRVKVLLQWFELNKI